jgi:hypothetical protein
MDLRLALIELAAQHRLDPARSRRLHALAGLDGPPPVLERWLPRGVALAAAALGGLGIIVWIAANWDDLGRFGRLALLQGAVLAMCAGALVRRAARAPLALLAMLAIGGLLAASARPDRRRGGSSSRCGPRSGRSPSPCAATRCGRRGR